VERSKLDGLELQMNSNCDYHTYRSTMKAAVWRSERESANKIERAIIPFCSLFLKDFNLINENHKTRHVTSIIV